MYTYDYDWTFTSMDAKIGSSTRFTWNKTYNIHTCLPMIASNGSARNVHNFGQKVLHSLQVIVLKLKIICH